MAEKAHIAAVKIGHAKRQGIMTPYRIYFDSNSGDELRRYDLGIPGSLEDIEPIKAMLKIGLHVILYQPNELEVEAVLDFDARHGRWVASPIWSTLKHLAR